MESGCDIFCSDPAIQISGYRVMGNNFYKDNEDEEIQHIERSKRRHFHSGCVSLKSEDKSSYIIEDWFSTTAG